MNSKRLFLSIIFIFLLCVGGYWLWISLWTYQPMAYVGITKVEWEGIRPSDERAYIYEIDIEGGTVTDSFPVSEGMTHVKALALDQSQGLLYAGGHEGTLRDAGSWRSNGIEVFDIFSKNMVRRVELEGDHWVSRLRLSPDGKRLFVSNPFHHVPEQRPEGEKGKSTWVVNSETGEFKFGVDRPIGALMTPSGDYSVSFPGQIKGRGVGKRIESIDEDKNLHYFIWDTQRLLDEEGGIFAKELEGIDWDIPYIQRPPQRRDNLQNWKNIIEFYDRETLEQIGEVDLLEGIDLEEISKLKLSGFGYSNITQDKNYLVGRKYLQTKPGDEGTVSADFYLIVIDLNNFEIHKTVKLWEGAGFQTLPVVY